jgi:hypothetical protein
MKYNIKKILLILLILVIFTIIPIVIWKLVNKENYVSFRNIGIFPQHGYIYYEQNNKINSNENDEYNKRMHYLREEDKNVEYNKRMRYLREEEEEH